jgi:hypothetical protein
MLQVNPDKRPSCEALLTCKIMQTQINKLSMFDKNIVAAVSPFYNMSSSGYHIDMNDLRAQGEGALLNSIRLPRALKQLQGQLPKSNYSSARPEPQS